MHQILKHLPVLAITLVPSVVHGQVTQDDVPLQNVSGRFIMYGVGSLKPVLFSADSSQFYITNQMGDRLAIFDSVTQERVLEVPTGSGLTTVAARPGTDELWLVDRVTSSLTVYDTVDKQIVQSIRVGAEPHDVVFTATGDRAYVSCSGVDRVDVVDTATYRVAKSIDIPAREPRGMARIGNAVYVVPLRSGNGTAPLGDSALGEATRVVHVADIPGAQPLPDRDLFKIDITPTAATDALDPSATLSELGTTLFNLHLRPGTAELWIPNSDALNADHFGEVAFVAGQVVRNRITIVDPTQTPPAVRILNLDDLAPTQEVRASTPTSVAFLPDGSRAFVTGYGTDRVGVLDIDDQGNVTWAGSIQIPSLDSYPEFSGPRGCAVSPDGAYLVTYNKVDNGYTRIPLAQLPTSTPFDYAFPVSRRIGYDRMPSAMKRGRGFFDSTTFSESNTSSCFSCHTDGDSDGLAWELSTFLDDEATPEDQLQFGLDVKGPMVTQSVRSLREVGPYHWRGEKRKLKQFNGTFKNLLENGPPGHPSTIGGGFFYIEQYLEELAIAPNPVQRLSRKYSPTQLAGADLFMNLPVQGSDSCADCHQLPLGTNNEVVKTFRGGESPTIVVPALRGVQRKLSTPMDLGATFGMRTELGAGLNHGGTAPTIEAVTMELDEGGDPLFQVTPVQAELIAEFVKSLDTGLAPSTGFQVTLTAANAAEVIADELRFLKRQALKGYCDLVYVTGPEFLFERVDFTGGMYDPATDRFLQASRQLPPLTQQQLVAKALAGRPVTFFGVARMRGKVMGLDRDNDDIYDLDELEGGTDPEFWDTDDDGFPDGYEVERGMDPLVPDASNSDADAPTIVDGPHVDYTTQTSIKVEFTTSEPSRAFFHVDGAAVFRRPLDHEFDRHFSYTIGGLNAESTHTILLDITDPNENHTYFEFDHQTGSFVRPRPVHVEAIDTLGLQGTGGMNSTMTVQVHLGSGLTPAAAGYDVRIAVYHEGPQGLSVVAADRSGPTNSRGFASISVPIPPSITVGNGEFTIVVKGVEEPAGLPAYVEADNDLNFLTVPF